jgi:hypothetical protein
MTPRRPLPAALPCHPCPHGSACCAFGVMLFADEAATLRRRFGAAALVWDGEDGTWRTAVVDNMCWFWDRLCTIHEEPFYPRICKGFPWRFGDTDEDYPYDVTICPELTDEG